ncbi:MAG TPA: hypothetical protein VIM79_23180, partial [Niastella sp.]
MKKINQYILAGIITGFVGVLLLTGCTKLKDTNYNQIVSGDFVPTGSDLPALAGAAYVDWRG